MKITADDFNYALQEVQPSFGVTSNEFEGCIGSHGVIEYDKKFNTLLQEAIRFVRQVYLAVLMRANKEALAIAILCIDSRR